MSRGLLIAAPASGSGKTTLTLGLLRALKQRGLDIASAKSGPDYIDPRFHEAACGAPCTNLDAFAMSPARSGALLPRADLVLVEGAMGLFDGAPPDGRGSAADLARRHGLPVVMVVDCARMAQSVRPLVAGFAQADPDVRVAGVILNRTGSPRHAAMLRRALAAPGLPPVLGALPRLPDLQLPARHLGLVQAHEHPELDAFIDSAAAEITAHIDLDALVDAAAALAGHGPRPSWAPAQRIALAEDAAFAFTYPHHRAEWRAAGAEVHTFSPLADAPVPEADLVILPGGYPELHAGRIAACTRFLTSLKTAAQDTDIYGECGGYMVLGEHLIDAEGHAHPMAGLLRLETSFAKRKLHLGYRHVQAAHGPFVGAWVGHEFHYASTLRAEGQPLFTAQDAEGAALPDMGLRAGRVAGSFAHLIDRAWT